MALTQTQIDAIRGAWCKETSADPALWTPENPAWGQCAVTALVVQDLIGGELLRVDVHVRDTPDVISHYRNIAPDGIIDLTFVQFEGAAIATNPQVRDRGYVLKFPITAERYRLLKSRAHLAYREAARAHQDTTKTAERAAQSNDHA